jgi:hypothetical protein
MADQFNTVGEVGHAMRGIRDQLSLHAKGFGIAVLLFAGAFGGLYYQTISISRDVNELRVTAARIESKIDAIRGDTQQTRADVGAVRTSMSAIPMNRPRDGESPSDAEANLLAAFGNAFGFTVSEVTYADVLASYGSVQLLMQAASEEEVQALQAACREASSAPMLYSTTALGACAAVVNR